VDELKIDCALTTKLLTEFLRNEISKAGFERGVIGMSGGLDSTVSTFLSVQALGADNVFGLLMPYKTSNPDSRAHAELAADQLGVRTELVDITPQIDLYFDQRPDADKIRRANKMARERMAVLYDYSKALKALVIGTGNKTEALLGYTTLWGDMACAINPIGDLYKTQVRQLARHLGVPQVIIDKPPSADLWAGQTDEGELGLTYAEVDKLLFRLVDHRKPPEDVIAEGFEADFVNRVVQMIKKSEYKRRMPLVAKLSQQ